MPSGAKKKPFDMTVKELQELKKALNEAEKKAELARKSEEKALKKLEKAENKEPKEVIPQHIQEKLSKAEKKAEKLKQELEKFKKQKEFAENESEKEQELKYLSYEANKTTLTLKLNIDEFLKENAITAFRKGAIATASDGTKAKLELGIEELEDFCREMRFALTGRKEVTN